MSETTSEWRLLITDFHKLDHADDPESLVLGQPATADELDALDQALGCTMPPEFRSLYAEANGYGAEISGETDWFFFPVSRIPKLTAEMRDWFEETHPEIAGRFVSIVDWGCGDASGFLFSESGTPVDGFFTFEHESYEFDADQDWNEFLLPIYPSIRGFLIGCTSGNASK